MFHHQRGTCRQRSEWILFVVAETILMALCLVATRALAPTWPGFGVACRNGWERVQRRLASLADYCRCRRSDRDPPPPATSKANHEKVPPPDANNDVAA